MYPRDKPGRLSHLLKRTGHSRMQCIPWPAHTCLPSKPCRSPAWESRRIARLCRRGRECSPVQSPCMSCSGTCAAGMAGRRCFQLERNCPMCTAGSLAPHQKRTCRFRKPRTELHLLCLVDKNMSLQDTCHTSQPGPAWLRSSLVHTGYNLSLSSWSIRNNPRSP